MKNSAGTCRRCPPEARPPGSAPASVLRSLAGALVLLVIVPLTMAACAVSARSGPSRSTTHISAEELGRVTVSNAYDAVAQLRPLWLTSRGRRSSRALTTEIVVAQNNSYFGPLSSLRLFPKENVLEMRYMDASQASAYLSGLGSRHVEAAIVVVLR